MQKQQPKQQIKDWIFNDAGLKFHVLKRNNIFKFKIQTIITNEWHQSEGIELQRISEQTIKAAFNPRVEAVSYQLTERQEKRINLRFKVKLEYLTTQFFEDIILAQVQMSKAQIIKYQFDELTSELATVQKKLIEKLNNDQKCVNMQKNAYISGCGPLWEFDLNQGRYILQFTGCYILEKLYNGEYEENYDDMGNANMSSVHNLPLKLRISLEQNKAIELTSPVPNCASSHEFPYYLSVIVKTKHQSKVIVQIVQGQNNTFLMNGNILTAVPLIIDT